MNSLIPLSEIPESLRQFNRIRYRNELAQGIFDLMKRHGLKRKELADLLGVSKSYITHIFSGERNLQADSLADVLLVLERTPHLLMATDFDAIRLPVDEASIKNRDLVLTATTEVTHAEEQTYGDDTTQETNETSTTTKGDVIGRIAPKSGFPRGSTRLVKFANGVQRAS